MKGSDIKVLRERLHLTQKALAEAIGVAPNTVARWERGEAKASPAMVDRLKGFAGTHASGDAITRTSSMAMDPHHQAILERLEGRLEPEMFEKCAADLLQSVWPGLVAVPGGADDGFDGAVADGSLGEPFQLIVTTGQQFVQNFRNSLRRACRQGWGPRHAIFATSRRITPPTRKKLFEMAKAQGIPLLQAFDQDWFASRLYREPGWCKRLLGVTGKPHALSPFPITQRPVFGTEILGREDEMQWLLDAQGDCVLVGGPGSGKTFLLQSLVLQGKARFVVDIDSDQIANDLRSLKPQAVIVDDAHVHLEWVTRLKQIKREVRADFRIIAASWPGRSSSVRTALQVGSEAVCQLDLIDADTMIEIIKSTGIRGSDELLRIIRKQAAGRPGLAITLVHLYLLGDVKEVVSGEGLVNQIMPSLDKILENDSTLLLAPFALGGDSGAKPEDVASCLGESLMEITGALAKLAASGIVAERPGNIPLQSHYPLAVEPAAMRGALVQRGFFRGVGSLPITKFLPIVCNLRDALETLIAARLGGADIPDLEHWLEEINSSDLWFKYACHGQQAANYVLDLHPELVVKIALPALLHAPDKAIPMLLNKAGVGNLRDDFFISPNQNPVLERLKLWIAQNSFDREKTLSERLNLLQHTVQWWEASRDTSTAVAAICIAFNPIFRHTRLDPGSGTRMTLTDGVLPSIAIDRLSESWPMVTEIIRNSQVVPWNELFDFMRSLSDRGLEIHQKSKVAANRFLQNVLRDLAEISHEHPGIQRKLEEISNLSDIEYSAIQDPLFELLYPVRDSTQNLDQDLDANNNLSSLAECWGTLSVDEIAQRMAIIEAEACLANITYPRRSPKFCEALSDQCADPVSIAKAFMDNELPADLVEPFVKKAVMGEPYFWPIVISCLGSSQYVQVGVSMAITLPDVSPEIVSTAIAKANNMERLIEHHCFRGDISEAALLEILNGEHTHLAVAAAIGYWHLTQGECIDGLLGEAWREAMLRSADADIENHQYDDYWIGEILKRDSGLATEWLSRLVCNEKIDSGIGREDVAKEVAETLTQQQRQTVLRIIPLDKRPMSIPGIVRALIGNFLDLYKQLLDSKEFAYLHLAPLGGKPSERWAEKAVLALDAGYGVDDVVEATQNILMVWSGNDSDMWADWRRAFEVLVSDIDPRIVSIGKRGARYMSKLEQRAKERERLESVYGYA